MHGINVVQPLVVVVSKELLMKNRKRNVNNTYMCRHHRIDCIPNEYYASTKTTIDTESIQINTQGSVEGCIYNTENNVLTDSEANSSRIKEQKSLTVEDVSNSDNYLASHNLKSSSSSASMYSTSSEKSLVVISNYNEPSEIRNSNGFVNETIDIYKCNKKITEFCDEKYIYNDNTMRASTMLKPLDSDISSTKTNTDSLGSNYSFDSLLNSVLKNNQYIKLLGRNLDNDFGERTEDKQIIKGEGIMTPSSNENSKLKTQYQVEQSSSYIESVSSLSTCSIATFKLMKSLSKIEIGINQMEIREKVTQTSEQYTKARANKPQSLMRSNKLTQKKKVQCNLKVLEKTKTNNANCNEGNLLKNDKDCTSDINEQANVNNKTSTKEKRKQLYDLKISKSHIKQLERFLNLVTETQKNFCSNDSLVNDKKSKSESELSVSESNLNDSSYYYESCDDTSNTEFLDAKSTFDCHLNDKASYLIKGKSFSSDDVKLKEFLNDTLNNTYTNHNINVSTSGDSYLGKFEAENSCFPSDLCMHVSLDDTYTKSDISVYDCDDYGLEDDLNSYDYDNMNCVSYNSMNYNYNYNKRLSNKDKYLMELKLYPYYRPLNDYHYKYQNIYAEQYKRDLICANLTVPDEEDKSHKNNDENICNPQNGNSTVDNASGKIDDYSKKNSLKPLINKIDSIKYNDKTVSNELDAYLPDHEDFSSPFSLQCENEMYNEFGKRCRHIEDTELLSIDKDQTDYRENPLQNLRKKKVKPKERNDRFCTFRSNTTNIRKNKYKFDKKGEEKLLNLKKHNYKDTAQLMSTRKQSSKGYEFYNNDQNTIAFMRGESDEHILKASATYSYLSTNNKYDDTSTKQRDVDFRSAENMYTEDSINNLMVKGILKKHSSSLLTENESCTINEEIYNEQNEKYDLLQKYDQRLEKKSVKFTIPERKWGESRALIKSVHPFTIMKNTKHSQLINSTANIDFSSKEKHEQDTNQRLHNVSKMKVITQSPNYILYRNLPPYKLRNVLCNPLIYHVLIKPTRKRIFMHLQQIENRLHKIYTPLSIIVPVQYNFITYRSLKPTKVYNRKNDFVNSFQDLLKGYSVKLGFIVKYEILNTVQYCKPSCEPSIKCINLVNIHKTKIQNNNIRNKFIFNKEKKGLSKKSKNLALKNQKDNYQKTTELNKDVQNVSCKYESDKNREQFLNYISNVRNSVLTKNVIDFKERSNVNSKIAKHDQCLFEVTTTSDAVLSLTAQEKDLESAKPLHQKLNKAVKELSIHARDGYITNVNECLTNDESPKTLSRVNITLGSLFKQKSSKKKNIQVRGSIINHDDHNNKISNLGCSEELPVHDNTQSTEELSSVDNYAEDYKMYLKENEYVRKKPSQRSNSLRKTGEKDNRKVRRKTSKIKSNYTNPNPFSFDRKENTRLESNSVSKPPFRTCVKTNNSIVPMCETKHKKHYTIHSKIKSHLTHERPHTCTGPIRPTIIDDKEIKLKRVISEELNIKNNNSKTTDASNDQQESLSSEVLLNLKYNNSESTPKSNNNINDDKFKVTTSIRSLDNVQQKQVSKVNSSHVKIMPSMGKKDLHASKTSKPSKTSQSKVKDGDNKKKEKLNNLEEVDSNGNEFISINDSHVICPVRENDNTESQSDPSLCSMRLKQELESIANLKLKVRDTFPETSSVKKQLLKKLSKLQSNAHVKPYFTHNEQELLDCFGAPLIDEFNVDYYNEFGKPIVNIYGCKIYDKCGIPKTGAYGKPIHNILRNKLKAVLDNMKPNKQPIERNEAFEDDLLNVLNNFHGLKTDLYGRLFDFYGRPLFDRHGYLQYDVNGNPLTDAYNRSLRDENGRTLISSSTSNSTRILSCPDTRKMCKKKDGMNSDSSDNYYVDQNTKTLREQEVAPIKIKSILSNSDNGGSSNETKVVKKQVSFNECTTVYLDMRVAQDPRKSTSFTHT